MKAEKPTKKSITILLQKVLYFLRIDIFRVKESDMSKPKRLWVRLLKKIILSVREFIEDYLPQRASSLTYYTVLSIIPIFALVVAIGRGFGFQDTIEEFVADMLGPNSEATPFVLQFVNSYLEQAHGGVFVGVGVVVLLWSVVSMFRQIESTFNYIWSVTKSRSIVRQFTTYISILLFVPILIVLSSSLMVRVDGWVQEISQSAFGDFLSPIYKLGVRLAPFGLYWILFTVLFVIIPNTKVKWKDAILSGIITGTAFLLMQYLYVSGLVSLSRYNAVYGSFAAIPMLLLLLQITWMIVLYGAEFCFVSQNLRQYNFDNESRGISRHYRDYVTFVVLRFIVKRFAKGDSAPTVEDISTYYNIPYRLVQESTTILLDCHLLSELYAEHSNTKSYQPALDINTITVSMVLNRLDHNGSENFMLTNTDELQNTTKMIDDIRLHITDYSGNMLIKDL